MMPLNETIKADVMRAISEDIGSGDVSAALLNLDKIVEAVIVSREPMLVCGQAWVDCVFATIDKNVNITWCVNEGAWLDAPTTLCNIKGPARSILTSERTALNFLQTLSATATQTYFYVKALQGYHTTLLDTRKTLPGLRCAQKYAVTCAGGTNHRMGLYDAFMIKENHIQACGSITNAINLARKKNTELLVEVEVETLAELREALIAAPDRILLDNFNLKMMQEAVVITNKRCKLEASGGINLTNLVEIAKTGVDYISIGALTKSIQAIDLSLRVI